MKNLLDVTVLRRWIGWFINKQPVHLQTWVKVSGTGGFDSPVSYAFDNSYVGGIADSTRQTFRDFTDFRTESGTVAEKSFVVILPYEAGKRVPQKGDMCILYRMDGTIYARAWTVFLQSYDAGSIGVNAPTIYKHELHLMLISSN